MKIKELMKNNPLICDNYQKAKDTLFSLATIISPTLNTKMRYRLLFRKKLNLKNPKTINEKNLWLKLKRYIKDPLVIQCADKLRVRDYVKGCGCPEILNELLGVYDSADEIVWESLPEQFALKWNFSAGKNYICTDKRQADSKEVLQRMRIFGKSKDWL